MEEKAQFEAFSSTINFGKSELFLQHKAIGVMF